jgi:hypothetical protein
VSVAKGMARLFAKKGPEKGTGSQAAPELVAERLIHFQPQAHTERASNSFSRPRRGLPSEERALWEAAIQMDLVTVYEAEELVARCKTVRTWMAEQRRDARKEHPRKSDKLLVFALLLFNLLTLAGVAMAIAWAFRTVFQ